MSDDKYYIGEIVAFAVGKSVMNHWHPCDGSTLSIADYEALYDVIGARYGGDGVNTFAVPDLRSRIIVSAGKMPVGGNYTLGSAGGTSSLALTKNEIPTHSHVVHASTMSADSVSPVSAVFATPSEIGGNARAYLSKNCAQAIGIQLSPAVIEATGANAKHNNVMPTLGVNYMIRTSGIYPGSR